MDISSNLFTNTDILKEKIELEPTYGAKLNIGTHVNEKNDLSIGIGVQNFNYSIVWTEPGWRKAISDSKLGLIIGLGYNYNINDNLSLNLEGNVSWVDLDGPAEVYPATFPSDPEKSVYDTEIKNIKLGMAYKF